jgi:carbonic anhydrase
MIPISRALFCFIMATSLSACSMFSRKAQEKPVEQTATPLDLPKNSEGPTVTLVKKGTDEPVDEKGKWAQTINGPEGKKEENTTGMWAKTNDGNLAEKGDAASAGESKNDSLCSDGKSQSPIDLKWHKPETTGGDITFNYKTTAGHVVDTGHSIQINLAPGSSVKIHGHEYDLISAHFHSPSEHLLTGKSAAMELHLVHKDSAGKLAVIGVLIKAGKFNTQIAKVLRAIPSEKEKESTEELALELQKLLPLTKTHYAYSGSLTTPPCTEGVEWVIFNNPLGLKEEQIESFNQHYSSNARPVQPLNGRKVVNY